MNRSASKLLLLASLGLTAVIGAADRPASEAGTVSAFKVRSSLLSDSRGEFASNGNVAVVVDSINDLPPDALCQRGATPRSDELFEMSC